MENNLLKSIGKQLAIKRMKANLTQVGLADLAKIDQAHIVRYEQGKINMTLETLTTLAAALGCRLQIRLVRDRTVKEAIIEEETKAGS